MNILEYVNKLTPFKKVDNKYNVVYFSLDNIKKIVDDTDKFLDSIKNIYDGCYVITDTMYLVNNYDILDIIYFIEYHNVLYMVSEKISGEYFNNIDILNNSDRKILLMKNRSRKYGKIDENKL